MYRGVVRCAPLLSYAPGAHARLWIWIDHPAHCKPITRSSPPPLSKSTSLSAVTQSYPRQPGKRLWRSNQLWLNTECDGSHYSKFRTAEALTTIDYLNIACVPCRRCHAHLLWFCLRREEVECPPLVYWYSLSFMMTKTIFLRKCHVAVISKCFPLYSFSHVTIFLSIHCVRMLYELYQMFHELAWAQKQGYQITHTLPCFFCKIVFQNPL